MSAPTWMEMRISLGNIITIVSVIAGLGVMYGDVSARQTDLQNQINDQKTLLAAKLSSEVAAAREATLVAMLDDLRQRLERIEKKLDR